MTMELPIACTLDEANLARRADEVREELFSGAIEWRELETGYAFCFPSDPEWVAKIAAFIASERTCCSFFRFALDFEPGMGPIWLSLTGPAGTKTFIESTFGVAASAETS